MRKGGRERMEARGESCTEGDQGKEGRDGETERRERKTQREKWGKRDDYYNEAGMMKGRKARNDHGVKSKF